MLCVVESLHVSCPFVLLPPDFLPCGARYLATSINEALDELNSKLWKVVRMEVQKIDLGASPLQILGVKVRRAFKKRFLKFSEAAFFCSRFAWTEKQNTPMCIGTCSLDVPTSAQSVQHPFCGRLETHQRNRPGDSTFRSSKTQFLCSPRTSLLTALLVSMGTTGLPPLPCSPPIPIATLAPGARSRVSSSARLGGRSVRHPRERLPGIPRRP